MKTENVSWSLIYFVPSSFAIITVYYSLIKTASSGWMRPSDFSHSVKYCVPCNLETISEKLQITQVCFLFLFFFKTTKKILFLFIRESPHAITLYIQFTEAWNSALRELFKLSLGIVSSPGVLPKKRIQEIFVERTVNNLLQHSLQ